MKKIDLGQFVTILANLGVLAGLLLLVFELNQNNRFAEEQADYSLLQESLRMNELVIQPEYARLYYRAPGDEPLSALDQQRRSTLIGGMFEQFEWIFWLPRIEAPVEAFRSSWRRAQPMDVWQDRKAQYSREFVEWVETEVIPQSAQ